MAFHIKNRGTEALARKVAALKGVGLTETIHEALRNELDRELKKPGFVETGLQFVRTLRAKAGPAAGRKADKEFRDALYERD